ncbi:MAG: hypothetical protein CVU84_03560 [Firmicutes bacterium HGW-Firmicutes-1]|jgi:hypothetical protein|nr:MAG: hypothetical protein CVU84_03560 [Firmicutes bacterium HGW-Firmicutes-1]
MKKTKGENGYINYYKKQYLLISLGLLVAVLIIYFIGKVFAKDNFVFFAVGSAIMILPAAQYLSKYFVFANYKSGLRDSYMKFKDVHEQLIVLSDLIIVKGKKTMFFDFIINTDKMIVACHKAQNKKNDKKEEQLKVAKDLLSSIFKPKGYDLQIIVFSDEEEVLTYLIQNVKGTMNNIDETAQDKVATIILQSAI